MRLSINKGDKGYKPPHECAKYNVFLNGQQVYNAVVADEERGFMTRIILVPIAGGRGKRKQLVHSLGKVEIVLRPAHTSNE
jgi:hypothetical protein